MKFQTPQEKFWTGTSGDEYIAGNQIAPLIPPHIAVSLPCFSRTAHSESAAGVASDIAIQAIAIRHVQLTSGIYPMKKRECV